MNSMKSKIPQTVRHFFNRKTIVIFQSYKNNFIQYPNEEMASSKQVNNALQTLDSTQQKQQLVIFFKSFLKYLKKNIQTSSSNNDSQNSIFDLKKTSGNISLELFLQRVISYFKCGNQAYICALCFIDRFLESESAKTENITLTMKNIFKIISVALLVSTKNYNDFYYANSYYARVCGVSLQQINQLQKQFLNMIDFNVFINSEQYKIYETLLENCKPTPTVQPKASIQKEVVVRCEDKNQFGNRTSEQQSHDSQTTKDEEEQRIIEVEATA